MKYLRKTILFLTLFAGVCSYGQDRSLYLELGGYAGFYSINYEKPISIKDVPLKLRAGVGAFPLDNNSGVIIVLPLGLNYEIGAGENRLDLGIGHTITTATSPSIFSQSNFSIGYLRKTDKKTWYRFSYNPLISHWVDFQYQHWVGFSIGHRLNNK